MVIILLNVDKILIPHNIPRRPPKLQTRDMNVISGIYSMDMSGIEFLYKVTFTNCLLIELAFFYFRMNTELGNTHFYIAHYKIGGYDESFPI